MEEVDKKPTDFVQGSFGERENPELQRLFVYEKDESKEKHTVTKKKI